MQNIQKSVSDNLISADGTHIHYEIYGDLEFKKTMILLHGLGGNLTAWGPQIPYFTSLGYTVVAFDLRGHGLSDRPTNISSYTIAHHAQDIYAFIKNYQLENITLVGQCLGGIVALELIKQYKIKPTALVLISTTNIIPWYFSLIGKTHLLSLAFEITQKLRLTWRRKGHMNVKPFSKTADIDFRRFAADISYMSLPSYIATCQGLFSLQDKHLTANLTCPTLIIHGKNDTFFPVAYAKAMQHHIRKSLLTILPDGNHILVLNNSHELNQSIKAFLQK